MDDPLLNEVFRFRHKRPSTEQSAQMCIKLAKAFAKGVEPDGSFQQAKEGLYFEGVSAPVAVPPWESPPAPSFSVGEYVMLVEATQCLQASKTDQKVGDIWVMEWFPAYGCALLVEMTSVVSTELMLVFPDGWRHELHFLPDDECVHNAVPTTFGVLPCGRLDPNDSAKFSQILQGELLEAQQRTGSARSAAVNEVGHQKTPQFIAALVKTTLVSLCGEKVTFAPYGGTTDVGLHTGGQYRDTCWPVVQAVVQFKLRDGGGLWLKAQASFELSLLRTALVSVHREAQTWVQDKTYSVLLESCVIHLCNQVDDLFFMLQAVARHAVGLLEAKYDVSELQKTCEKMRKVVDDLNESASQRLVRAYKLPGSEGMKKWRNGTQSVELPLPTTVDLRRTCWNFDDVHKYAVKNLAHDKFVRGWGIQYSNIIRWIDTTRVSTSPYALVAILRSVERFMIAMSMVLDKDRPMGQCSPNEMQTLIVKYESCVQLYNNLPASNMHLAVEQQSVVLLIKWICFSLLHQWCSAKWPLLKQFKIALDWQALHVAVLSDREHIDALRRVARYIRRCNRAKNPPVFHLTQQEGTLQFGREFANSDAGIRLLYDTAKQAWSSYVAGWWESIAIKKECVKSLRKDLADAEEDLRRSRQELKDAQSVYRSERNGKNNRRVREAKGNVRTQEGNVSSINSNLYYALQMPPPLTKALPYDELGALTVLFFLNMPRTLEILGELCISAQLALSPNGPTDKMQTGSDYNGHQLWLDHFNQHKQPESPHFSQGSFSLGKYFGGNWEVISPQTVDGVTSERDYEAKCVWAPSVADSRIWWKDSRGQIVDPFLVAVDDVRRAYTESLPDKFSKLQWTISYPGGAVRGNLVYSHLGQIPEEFDRAAFIALGSLRAFPNQQFRKLLCALRTNALPWSHPCVETIVRQALYQIGDLTDEELPALLWKTDMLVLDDGMATFVDVLKDLAGKLEQTPRLSEQVPLLSEITSFACQFASDRDSRQIMAQFSRMARTWAEHESASCEGLSDSAEIAEHRAKECILYGYAIVGYCRLKQLKITEARELCELVVLFHTARLFASHCDQFQSKLESLERRVFDVMARQVVFIVPAAVDDAFLNSLLRLVVSTAPTGLSWSPTAQTSHVATVCSCYYAFDELTSTHYSINLFTGSVLTDGNAPGGLPQSIRNHPRYKKLFGAADFEVNTVHDAFHTVRAYDGIHYEFALHDSELVVNELEYAAGDEQVERTLQLCSVAWLDKHFGMTYPTRLHMLYSHWYWVEERCVLIRPPSAKDHSAMFIVRFGDNEANPTCYQVPVTDIELKYTELLCRLPSYDYFVHLEHRVQVVLSKLEVLKYIHVLCTAGGTIRIELPRFELSFALDVQGKLVSEQYLGYFLDSEQQLSGFLPRFSQYLLLQSQSPTPFKSAITRMLVPNGCVERGSSLNMVRISVSDAHDARFRVVCYDRHRRLDNFMAETIGARLQLAAIYASSGTSVPSANLGMTGAEAAIQELRHCTSSRPYGESEQKLLKNVSQFGYREPSLKLLATSLLDQANRLSVLFQSDSGDSARCGGDLPTKCGDAAKGYMMTCEDRLRRCRLRYRILSDDDRRLNLMSAFSDVNATQDGDLVQLEDSPVPEAYVSDIEATLASIVTTDETNSSEIPRFPLNEQQPNALSHKMYDSLKESWRCFHRERKHRVGVTLSELRVQLAELLDEVCEKRALIGQYLRSSYALATADQRSSLLRTMNFVAALTKTDVVHCALDIAVVRLLAPKLSQEGQTKFHRASLQLLEFWVLEDKLHRVVDGLTPQSTISTSQLIDELLCMRQWKSAEHPYWLAFEVEGRIQIRHEQYVVAQHLLSGPGTLCQLNMGRGKTRVILPMLFLYLGNNKSKRSEHWRATRVTFLSALISEARHFMQRFLVANSSELRIMELPFHRHVELDYRTVQLIAECVEHAKRRGDVLIVAPEHRMSLELKMVELQDCEPEMEPTRRILAHVLDPKQYYDVLDESDAVLHHKYHLVYAAGAPEGLDGGAERWETAQALLEVVTNPRAKRVAEILAAEPRHFEYRSRLGAYDGMRLNPPLPVKASSTTRLDERTDRDALKRAIMEDLLDDPPFEYQWAAMICENDTELRSLLVRILTEASVDYNEATAQHKTLLSSFSARLLALRGLVAFGVFEHCLELRYRVQYGLPDPGSRDKRLAIPFHASDVPSERSEFSHPDVAITLTLLAYYHAGLRDNEVREVFAMLLRLDESEQVRHYGQWFARVRNGLTSKERAVLADVHHLSLSDARQVALLCRVFRFCMGTINFFLNSVVFPRETQQYPQRFARSAWHLASNERALVGFSGTNDNQLLLPLSVTQQEPEDSGLRATNGKMLDRILKSTNGCEVIATDEGNMPAWQRVLRFALSKDAQALIDTGALLAGVAPGDAAMFVAKSLRHYNGHGLLGVTFFDSRKTIDRWMVIEASMEATAVATALEASALTERDTFVIFDEARTRGADMKLPVDASAVVTLGPRLTKAKLMQGAGRMRQLGGNQTLWFACFADVAQRVGTAMSVTAVLNWVMTNTTDEATRGLIEWASSGLQFERARRDPANEAIDDDWSLTTLYAGGQRPEMVADIIYGKIETLFGNDCSALSSRVRTIEDLARRFGMDDVILVTAHTDECERELQVENEREEHREVEFPSYPPITEQEWDYKRVMAASSVRSLDGIVSIVPISKLASSVMAYDRDAKLLRHVSWSGVWCTTNFYRTVVMHTLGLGLSVSYLRTVDFVLAFQDGTVLLLSEFEADQILAVIWASRAFGASLSSSTPVLFNLAMAVHDIVTVGIDYVSLTGSNLCNWVGLENLLSSVVACALLDGETMFSGENKTAAEQELRSMLSRVPNREEAARGFVRARGRGHRWKRSPLQVLAAQMDLAASVANHVASV